MRSDIRARVGLPAATRRRARRTGGATAALVLALLLSGCGGAEPRQINSAAIVGDTGVSLSEIQSQVDAVMDREGEEARAHLVANRQLDDVSRQIVTQHIRSALIQIQAERVGVSVTPQEVSKLLYDLGGLEAAVRGTIWTEEQFREQYAPDLLLLEKLGRKALTTAVTVDYTTATTREGAIARAQELAEAGERGARQKIKADVDADREAVLDKRVVAGDDPIFATTPVFGVPEGTVLAFQITDTDPWLVVVVKNRADGAKPSKQAPDPDDIDPTVLRAIGLRQLYPVATEVGVRLNPRFGVWDPVNLQAIDGDDEPAGFVTTLAAPPA